MTRNMKILFTASIILNVVLIGMHAGKSMKRWHHWQPEMAGLSPEAQDIVAQSIQNSQKTMKEKFEASRAAKKNVMKVLQAEEFDEQAFAQASGELQNAFEAMMMARLEAMKALSMELAPEDRAKLSPRIFRPHRGKKHHTKERKADR